MTENNVNLRDEIYIRPGTDKLGPYEIDFAAYMPPGLTISTVILRAYLGAIETTAYLIEPDSAAAVSDSKVQFRLQWPDHNGQTYPGRHKLVFVIVYNDGSMDEAWAAPVIVKQR